MYGIDTILKKSNDVNDSIYLKKSFSFSRVSGYSFLWTKQIDFLNITSENERGDSRELNQYVDGWA